MVSFEDLAKEAEDVSIQSTSGESSLRGLARVVRKLCTQLAGNGHQPPVVLLEDKPDTNPDLSTLVTPDDTETQTLQEQLDLMTAERNFLQEAIFAAREAVKTHQELGLDPYSLMKRIETVEAALAASKIDTLEEAANICARQEKRDYSQRFDAYSQGRCVAATNCAAVLREKAMNLRLEHEQSEEIRRASNAPS